VFYSAVLRLYYFAFWFIVVLCTVVLQSYDFTLYGNLIRFLHKIVFTLHGRSWYSSASTGLFLSGRGISTTMVSILPVTPAAARASRIFLLITRLHGVWCTPGFHPWGHTFPAVLRRPAADQ